MTKLTRVDTISYRKSGRPSIHLSVSGRSAARMTLTCRLPRRKSTLASSSPFVAPEGRKKSRKGLISSPLGVEGQRGGEGAGETASERGLITESGR